MNHIFDQSGFEDCILKSDDDYEPYGYVAPQLVPIDAVYPSQTRNITRDRVIDRELLNQYTLVGC